MQNVKPTRAGKSGGDNLPFIEHLEELRRRVLLLLLSCLITACFLFGFFNQLGIFRIFTAPLSRINQKLYFQNLAEPLMVRVKISLVLSVILNLPLFLYHLLRFIFPALKRKEKKTVLGLLVSIIFLFFTGVFFADRILLPYSVSFLIRFAGKSINPIISLREYINLYLGLMVANGLIFLFPVLIFFLSRMKLVSHGFLIRHTGEAVLVILTVAAVLTPPDVVSQIFLAVPLLFLYLISAGLAWLNR